METETTSYEEFFEKVKSCVGEMLGKEYILYHNHVRKNNDIWLDGIVIRHGTETICPTVYLDRDFYEVNKEKEIEVAAKYILSRYQEALTCNICKNVDLSYEYAMPRIIYRLVSKEKNEEMLKECPTVPFLDLVVTFHILLDGMPDREQATIHITNNMLDVWGIETKELAKLADENTKRHLPPAIYTLREMLGKMMLEEMQQMEMESFRQKESKILEEGEEQKEDSNKDSKIELLEKQIYTEQTAEQINKTSNKMEMYVLTNAQNIYGATTVIYKDAIRDFSQKLQCDLYLLPSSVHEFILIPAKHSFEKGELEDMVQIVNRTQLPKEEFLSDFVYYYCREEGKFKKL